MSDPDGGCKLSLAPSISFGNILARLVVAGVLFAGYADMASRIKELEVKLDQFKAFLVSERHPPCLGPP